MRLAKGEVPVLGASDRRSEEEAALSLPSDRPLACTATPSPVRHAWKNTSSDTLRHRQDRHTACTLGRTYTHALWSSCCAAPQSRLCPTWPGVSSILSGEDGDEFLSCQPVIMVLTVVSLQHLICRQMVSESVRSGRGSGQINYCKRKDLFG